MPDIMTVQELLENKDAKTTMIFHHDLNRGGKGVKRSVADLYRRSEGVFIQKPYISQSQAS